MDPSTSELVNIDYIAEFRSCAALVTIISISWVSRIDRLFDARNKGGVIHRHQKVQQDINRRYAHRRKIAMCSAFILYGI